MSYVRVHLVLSAAVVLAASAATAAPAAPPAWGPLGLPASSVTDSTKWTVHLAPDGAGGLIAAWEENRGRKMCCRDTRDIYCQRLDAAGRPLWGEHDRQVAADGLGEEILAVLPGPGGGFGICWRRGGGSLYLQQFDERGLARDGVDGTLIAGTTDFCEWQPEGGCALAADGAHALLVWGQPAGGDVNQIRAVAFSRSADGWRPGPVAELARARDAHPGAVVATAPGAYLAFLWTSVGGDVELYASRVTESGRPYAAPVRADRVPGARWAHVEAAADGAGGAFAGWAAVQPEHLERTHTARLAWAGPGAIAGTFTTAVAVAGPARTAGMYIPPTTVGTAGGPELNATRELMAWRATTVMAPAGRGAAWLVRMRGDVLEASYVTRSGETLRLSSARTLGTRLFSGFTPRLAAAGDGGLRLAWAEILAPGSWRIAGTRLSAPRLGAPAAAPVETLAGPLAIAPRFADLKADGDGWLLGWTTAPATDVGDILCRRGGPSPAR